MSLRSHLSGLALAAILVPVLSGPVTATPLHAPPPVPLLELLGQRKFDALQERLAMAETGFRRGRMDDFQLKERYWEFCTPKHPREEQFDGWASAREATPFPFLARAIHHYCLAQEARGDDYIDKVPAAGLQRMRQHMAQARADLDMVLRIAPDSFLAHYVLMKISSYQGNAATTRHHFDAADRIAPRSFLARLDYMHTLTIRWGGSIRQMQTFLSECREAGLPEARLRALEAQVISDEAWAARQKDDLAGAIRHYRRFLALMTPAVIGQFGSGHFQSELQDALRAAKKTRDYNAIESFTTHALEAAPGQYDRYRYSNRGWARYQMGRKPEALQDYLKAAELGDAYAQNAAGAMLFLGDGVPKDVQRALPLIEKAAAAGDADARKNLYWARRKLKAAQ